MRVVIHLAAVIGLALPIGLTADRDAEELPGCRASFDGAELTTTIEFPDGYLVAAPWQVVWQREASLDPDSPTRHVVVAELDRIIEENPATGERKNTPFPDVVETTFEGVTQDDLIANAAQTWCTMVIEVQQMTPAQPMSQLRFPIRRA